MHAVPTGEDEEGLVGGVVHAGGNVITGWGIAEQKAERAASVSGGREQGTSGK